MVAGEARRPEPHDGVARFRPLQEIERGGDAVAWVEGEVLRLGVAFADQGLDGVAAEGSAAEAELDDEIGEAERGIALRWAVDTVVGVESGLPVVVNGAGSPTSRRWLTVEIGAAPGGVGVGVVVIGFLHGWNTRTKP